jgi:hypothetical protein
MRDLDHIWQVAEKIVYLADVRARVRVHPPGLKAPEGESIFCQCARQLPRNNSGSRVVPRQLGANLRESLP